ncbi:hypothetical protein SAMN05444392_102252 [Seinonella peptonophila]|uniref:Uncharacterized protein n=1 Tax=Seinonella peptonophila TaxID=112248 RepID=A0A1M4V9U6_9BACL|nr:hypothetical protein [Seinonella peptonophila]SHE65702.1 hypothetical protein SAMN05444392_102252 [Seinonella peptonophila]
MKFVKVFTASCFEFAQLDANKWILQNKINAVGFDLYTSHTDFGSDYSIAVSYEAEEPDERPVEVYTQPIAPRSDLIMMEN